MTKDKDFFVSYTGADHAWAEWIGWQLEQAGFTCELQKWDFGVGSNFVAKMHEATKMCKRTIPVLSQAYEQSKFATSEWMAAFAQDPDGAQGKVVGVRIEDYTPTGLLGQIVYIDLVGLNEQDAANRLLSQISGKRAKPGSSPPFPGNVQEKPSFPGATRNSTGRRRAPMPKSVGRLTELSKRRILKGAFSAVELYFQDALKQYEEETGQPTLLEKKSEVVFEALIEHGGKIKAHCRVSQSEDIFNGITFFEGQPISPGSVNEVIEISDDGTFKAQFGAFALNSGSLNPDRLESTEEVGEYLWRRFIWRLQ